MGNNSRNKLPDTPWHVSFTKKEKEDPRRHKSWCIHINKKTGECYCGISPYFMTRCGGSAHCVTYAVTREQWEHYLEEMKTEEDKQRENSEKRAALYRMKKQRQAYEAMTDDTIRAKYTINPKMTHCPICLERFKKKNAKVYCAYCGFILMEEC